MTDDELYQMMGKTHEEVEADVEEFEHGDWSHVRFGAPKPGRPRIGAEKMVAVTVKLPPALIRAVDGAAKGKGVSRSAYIRHATERELVADAK